MHLADHIISHSGFSSNRTEREIEERDLDGTILANRLRAPKWTLLFANPFLGHYYLLANRRFEAIPANRSNVMKIGAFLRIGLREEPRFALRIAWPSKDSIERERERL